MTVNTAPSGRRPSSQTGGNVRTTSGTPGRGGGSGGGHRGSHSWGRGGSARHASGGGHAKWHRSSHAPADNSTTDRYMALISMLVGQMVVVSVHGSTRYVGVLSSGTLSSGSEPGIVLCSAQVLETTEKSVRAGEVLPTLTIALSDVLEVDASGARVSSAQELQAQQAQQRRASGFRTDTEISGQTGARDGRTLQRWDDSSAGPAPVPQAQASLEQSTRAGPWDQFAENEARFGVTSNYEETMYTTKLDKGGKDFQAREKEAERLAKEILEGSTSNAHVAEERNQVPAQEANEEDRYGAVVREPPASSAPPVPPVPPATTSSGKALTADFRQFVSAERERLVVRKAELAQKEKQSRLADLKVWAQTFQLKTPMPEDMAMAMKKRADAAQSKSTSTVSSPATGPSAPVDQTRQKLAAMTIPAIPPFKKAEEKKAPSKLNAKASAFNPTAAPFTQGARVSVPSVPFFGTRELKNRPNMTHLRVSDDFRAPKSKKLGEASKTSVWWSYTGRPFRQQVAMGVNNKPPYMGEGPMPMGAAPSLMPVAAASPYTPGLSPTLPPGAMLASNSPTQPPTSGACPPGKSPRASHQQAMMMPPPPPPSGTTSPHPVAQQPYAFVYPMGQYPFPTQQPYMPPPDAPGAPPMLYRAPPPPGFGASYAPVPAGAPGAMPPHGPYGVGHPPSPPKRSHARGPKPHHRLSKAWAAETGASTEGPPKTGST